VITTQSAATSLRAEGIGAFYGKPPEPIHGGHHEPTGATENVPGAVALPAAERRLNVEAESARLASLRPLEGNPERIPKPR
jgi:cysteine sulfinate desulfinase/cysteine desulfurase-like protein